MSNKRITDLTELTTPTTDDVFPIVDIATNTTQKVQVGNLPIQTAVTTALATKQDTLVSGTNIKTVNSTSLVGSGNVTVQPTLVSGTNIKTINSTTLLGSGDIAVQPTLVSGTNIKTLNSVSLLGSGDIVLTANPSGVSGAIQFSNGSAFASDAANFFWDNTNKRLGIGTNTPDTTAHFKGGVAGSVGVRVATFEGNLPEILFKDTSNNTGFAIAKYGGIVYFVNTNSSGAYSSYSGLTNSQGQWSFGGGFNPSGTVHIKGSGSTSATTSLLVQNSAGTAALTVKDDLTSTFGGSIFINSLISTNSASSFFNSSFQNAKDNFYCGGTTNLTSGNTNIFQAERVFQPSSGTATYIAFYANPTINQTGGANGITRGLYINPTLTAAADFRAIEVSNGGAYINTTSVQASAILQADSTTKGFLPPRMTTTQKNAIASPLAGLQVYDTTTNKLCCYNGSTWNDLF